VAIVAIARAGDHLSLYRARRICARVKDSETKGDLSSCGLRGPRDKNSGRTQGQQTTVLNREWDFKEEQAVELEAMYDEILPVSPQESRLFLGDIWPDSARTRNARPVWGLDGQTFCEDAHFDREAQHELPKLTFRSDDEVSANRHPSSHAPLRTASKLIASNKTWPKVDQN